MAEDDVGFTAIQAAEAVNALRRAAGLKPERFPRGQFVAMISDEIRTLRQAGRSDLEISAILAGVGIDIDAPTIGRAYIDTSQVPRERPTT